MCESDRRSALCGLVGRLVCVYVCESDQRSALCGLATFSLATVLYNFPRQIISMTSLSNKSNSYQDEY